MKIFLHHKYNIDILYLVMLIDKYDKKGSISGFAQTYLKNVDNYEIVFYYNYCKCFQLYFLWKELGGWSLVN